MSLAASLGAARVPLSLLEPKHNKDIQVTWSPFNMALTTAGLWCKILHPMGHPVAFAVLWDSIKQALCVQFVIYTVFILVIKFTAVF